jgi:hypothetical protein
MMDTLRFYDLAILGESHVRDRPILENFVDEAEGEIWRMHKGQSMAAHWPKDARIYLTGEEDGIELAELVGTTRNVIIAGPGLVALVKKHCKASQMEYLPVSIRDHRKRLLSDAYTILNPLGTHDCADLEESKVRKAKGTGALRLDEVVIDKARGAKAPQLFRLHHRPMFFVLRYELAADIVAAKLPNVVWTKLGVSG